jgi:sulfide:quinone oxidoreductase
MARNVLVIGGGFAAVEAAIQHRDLAKEQLVPLPVVGHWLKEGWGAYYEATKLERAPRLPGM